TRIDTVTQTVTIPGAEVDCPETTDKATGKTYIPRVKCPDTTYEQKTIREQQVRIQESRAKAGTAQHRANEATGKLLAEQEAHGQTIAERDKYKKERNTLLWIIGIAITGFIAFKAIAGGLLRR